MQKDNQLARIEQYLESIQTPESNNAVILLDSELDEVGAEKPTNSLQNCANCVNRIAEGCSSNGGDCSNYGYCSGSHNGGACENAPAKQVGYVGCS